MKYILAMVMAFMGLCVQAQDQDYKDMREELHAADDIISSAFVYNDRQIFAKGWQIVNALDSRVDEPIVKYYMAVWFARTGKMKKAAEYYVQARNLEDLFGKNDKLMPGGVPSLEDEAKHRIAASNAGVGITTFYVDERYLDETQVKHVAYIVIAQAEGKEFKVIDKNVSPTVPVFDHQTQREHASHPKEVMLYDTDWKRFYTYLAFFALAALVHVVHRVKLQKLVKQQTI